MHAIPLETKDASTRHIGLLTIAKSYIQAALHLGPEKLFNSKLTKFLYPRLHLTAHAIELGLKAIVRQEMASSGTGEDEIEGKLKSLGHNLDRCERLAKECATAKAIRRTEKGEKIWEDVRQIAADLNGGHRHQIYRYRTNTFIPNHPTTSEPFDLVSDFLKCVEHEFRAALRREKTSLLK